MNVTLVTPTYRRDYSRFLLQRESIERCGIDLPHVAIVDTEDMSVFRDMPFQRNLTLLSSRQVLGRDFDRRRTVWGISRKDYRYWITGTGVHGWMAQQLMKLGAANVVDTDAYVCLDSDTIFLDGIAADDFYSENGKLHLYETTDDLDVEMAEWYAHSLRFLGVKETGVVLRRFTHSPVPLHTGIVRDMCRFIADRHKNNWMEAMFRAERITEYATYGTFARHIDGLKRVTPKQPDLAFYFWWPIDSAKLVQTLLSEVEAKRPKAVLINSNMGIAVEVYEHAVRAILESSGKRRSEGASLRVARNG